MLVFQVIGLGVTAVGIWLHAQHDIYAYMTIYVRSATDTSLVSAAGLLLAAGIILTLTSIVGLLAALREHQRLLMVVSINMRSFVCFKQEKCQSIRCKDYSAIIAMP